MSPSFLPSNTTASSSSATPSTTPPPPPPSLQTMHHPPPSTLHLPRLLCLHGGGVNASIFFAQSRSLLKRLSPHFRLVFADAPFFCDPHSDIIPVYTSHAPFRRWLRWLPTHTLIDAESAIDEISYSIRGAIEDDDRMGATGEWVGLMGFSQGAKLAASMLVEQQVREKALGGEGRGVGVCGVGGVHWRFGVIMAGRAPLVALDPERQAHCKSLVSAADISEGFQFLGDGDWVEDEAKLKIPTVHVHGMADPGLSLHRKLYTDYCEKGTAKLIEWDGAHRIPLKAKDVDPIVDAIFDLAWRTGVKLDL